VPGSRRSDLISKSTAPGSDQQERSGARKEASGADREGECSAPMRRSRARGEVGRGPTWGEAGEQARTERQIGRAEPKRQIGTEIDLRSKTRSGRATERTAGKFRESISALIPY
jgi:hypothetical protein